MRIHDRIPLDASFLDKSMRLYEFTNELDNLGYEKTASLVTAMRSGIGAVKGFAQGLRGRWSSAILKSKVERLSSTVQGQKATIGKLQRSNVNLNSKALSATDAADVQRAKRTKSTQLALGMRSKNKGLAAENATLSDQVGNRTRDLMIAGGGGLAAGVIGSNLMRSNESA